MYNRKTDVSALISQYRSLPRWSQERKNLYEVIVSKVREIFYFMPQECFGVNEEDCAEFLLKNENRIPGIISAYNEAYDDFEAFIYPTIEKCIRGFKKSKNYQFRKEESILYCHSGYEYELEELENSTENIAVSETMREYGREDNIALQRLKFIFAKAPKTRDRFYIFFISYAELMMPDEVRNYCSTFRFSYNETVKILSFAKKIQSSKSIGLEHAIEKRNEYYGKKMYYENELAMLNFLSDHSKDEIYRNVIDRCDYYSNIQNISIHRFSKRMPRSEICRIFNKVDGTVANSLFFTKNLIEWCMNPANIPKSPGIYLGVCERILNLSQGEKNIYSIKRNEIPLLHPIRHFHLHLSLN